ncbi:MAG: hypothetical protein IKB88_04805 [Clostridia bacterium]|nr:hypothetical protein [Clostridia bacterium]
MKKNTAVSKITILLTTSDKYSDAWSPFIHFWNINCPNLNFPIVVNSETKIFKTDNPNIRTFSGGSDLPWSKRMINCLKTIESEYVLLCLEDYFIQSAVDEEIFNAAVNTMESDKKIGVIQFAIDISCRYDESVVVNKYFSPVPVLKTDSKTHNGRIYCVLSLYRKDYLKKLLVPTESPWEFEIFGTLRSQYFREKVYREREDHKRCFNYLIEPKYGYGISRGKWLPKNKELFEKFNIDVDFSNLGILSEEEWLQWVEIYKGNKKKTQTIKREHRSKQQIIMLLFKNPKEFFDIFRNILKKKKKALKDRFPFIR